MLATSLHMMFRSLKQQQQLQTLLDLLTRPISDEIKLMNEYKQTNEKERNDKPNRNADERKKQGKVEKD
jgi:hypothetical protein